MNIFGFWHIYTINNWSDIVINQKDKIIKSKLAENSSKIFVNVAGEIGDILDSVPNTVVQKSDPFFGENPAIKLLYEFCLKEEECFVWYIHAKGVTRPENNCVSDWRRCLEYFNICRWKKCVESLFENDIAGALWEEDKHPPHFRGNFWWARSSYIKKCESIELSNNRHKAEFFIGTGKPKVKNLHQTNLNHYKKRYGYGNFVKIF